MMSGAADQNVALNVLSWQAGCSDPKSLWPMPLTKHRVAYTLNEPRIGSESGGTEIENDVASIRSTYVHVGVPIRNQMNTLKMEWGDSPVALAIRATDAFGEVLVYLNPSKGTATAYSVTINRLMDGGFSHSSPMPEEQMIERIGRFTFSPVGSGVHEVCITAIEENVSFAIDSKTIFELKDPDVAGGCVGIGTPDVVRLISVEQTELVSKSEALSREEFVSAMTKFAEELDSEYESDIAANNSLRSDGGTLDWQYPETGARLSLWAKPGMVCATANAGLYGDARMLDGMFAQLEVGSVSGDNYTASKTEPSKLECDQISFRIITPLESPSGGRASATFTAKLTENATWFCTMDIQGVEVKSAALSFQLDGEFAARMVPGNSTEEDEAGLSKSVACTDTVVGQCWTVLLDYDSQTRIQKNVDNDTLVIRSQQSRFRWALMWLPFHKLNLSGFKKRTVHFIRYPQTPVQEWRERPSVCEYPTDEELERFASNGAKAITLHHTWVSNNYRKREGFIVNETEMRRAMKKAKTLGIEVNVYIGIVPGRHPALRYEDQAGAYTYDKNWDLQDFTFYSVAGRWQDFLPFMTDYWCREYGIDGFYADGGLASPQWGRTGLSEKDFGGMSREELTDRCYSRVRRVLRRHNAPFGLERWGGAGFSLTGPFYDIRMIGEAFTEASPEQYRDTYNTLLTGTPFKMYGMDLTARNRYNVAMAAVCLTDIKMCSGNNAWGNWPDTDSDWKNLSPFWRILDSIDWDNLTEMWPWWAQKLVTGEDVFAGHYTTPNRVVLFLANRTEEPLHTTVKIELDQLPEALCRGRIRPIYPYTEAWTVLGDGSLTVDLPRLHEGPLGFEIVAP